MATTEKVGIFTHVDDKGNTTLLYPVTNMEAVYGLPEALDNDFVKKTSVVNNFTTTEEGFVADARALKVLMDSLNSVSFISKHVFVVNNTNSSSAKTLKIETETCTFFAFEGGGSIFAASVSWNSNLGALDLNETKNIYGTPGIKASYSNKVTTLTIPAWSSCAIITTTPGTLVD